MKPEEGTKEKILCKNRKRGKPSWSRDGKRTVVPDLDTGTRSRVGEETHKPLFLTSSEIKLENLTLLRTSLGETVVRYQKKQKNIPLPRVTQSSPLSQINDCTRVVRVGDETPKRKGQC